MPRPSPRRATSGKAPRERRKRGRDAPGPRLSRRGRRESIELEGEVGIEGSEVGVEKEASARARAGQHGFSIADLSRPSAPDLSRKTSASSGWATTDDATRLARGGERLLGDHQDARRIELEGLADEPLGHGAREIRSRARSFSSRAASSRGVRRNAARERLRPPPACLPRASARSRPPRFLFGPRRRWRRLSPRPRRPGPRARFRGVGQPLLDDPAPAGPMGGPGTAALPARRAAS